MKKIKINLKNESYPIFYESNLLEIRKNFIIDFCKKLANNFVIITHKNLENLLAKPFIENFNNDSLRVSETIGCTFFA